jgi:hypothetical protein
VLAFLPVETLCLEMMPFAETVFESAMFVRDVVLIKSIAEPISVSITSFV